METGIEKKCLLRPGVRPDLKRIPPELDETVRGDKKAGAKEFDALCHELSKLQRILYAERKRRILIVLQGMDTSGKDGTIRHVFRYVNPNGVQVAAFDRPSPLELSYDYLWRVHKKVPRNGEIVIFDRSHYEDIVTVRVNQLRPPSVWKNRYRHLQEFERYLAEEGTTILKFFLHIDREAQRERLVARLENPNKHWKFDASDLVARSNWDAYMVAYADALERCNSDLAPWYIIPANHKWVRNLLVARVVVAKLRSLNMEFPKPNYDPGAIEIGK